MDAETTTIKIRNVPPYDGDYEVFDRGFSAKEWRWIKQVSDGEIRPSNLDESLGDPYFIIALAVIGMRRAGKITAEQVLEVADVLAEAPLEDSYIELVVPEREDEAVPPASASKPNETSTSGLLDSTPSNERTLPSSGDASRNGSDQSGESPEPTGTTPSGTSSTSDPTTSTT